MKIMTIFSPRIYPFLPLTIHDHALQCKTSRDSNFARTARRNLEKHVDRLDNRTLHVSSQYEKRLTLLVPRD